MKKVLYVSHTANFSKFNRPFMNWFHEQKWQVDYASDGKEEVKDCDHSYIISFERSPFSFNNIKAYKQLKALIEKEGYDIVHCHTPVGGTIARLASRKRRKEGMKVLYTGHGFHFFKGAPAINWMIYYPVEKYVARFTDTIVTINEEDYQNAVRRKFRAKQIKKIDGVGVRLDCFKKVSENEKKQLRQEYQFGEDDFIMICVAEINKNKDQKFMLENLSELKAKIQNLKVLIVGVGPLQDECEKFVEQHHLEDSALFLGYRSDVNKLLQVSDVLISSSHREGLAVNIIEAMATGLPVICANTRGQRDLITSGENGFVYELGNQQEFCKRIIQLSEDKQLCEKISANSLEKVKKYSMEKAVDAMAKIYSQYM